MDRKADLVGRLPDDLDGNAGGARGPLSGIARIREGFGDEWERAPRQPQDQRRAVLVLDVGRLGLQDQAAPVGIDHDLPLAPLHLLAGVVASGPSLSVVLTLWLSMTAAEGDASRPTDRP